MGKDKGGKKGGGGKSKDKGGKKGGKSGKKGKKGGKKGGKKMSTGKKVAIGAGVAALAVGGLAVGKYAYDKNKAKKGTGGAGKRGMPIEDGPIDPALAPYMSYADESQYKTSTATIPIPDAVTLGLGWTGQSNLDLLVACYDAYGQNKGYLSGQNLQLFNGALTHTGDDQSGSGSLNTVLGDNENAVCDLSQLPPDVHSIAFGAMLQSGSPSRAYFHICPLMRESQLPAGTAGGPGTRGIIVDSDSEDDSCEDSDDDSCDSDDGYGTRAVPGEGAYNEDEHQFITLFHGEPTQYPDFLQKKCYVAAKICRNQQGGWLLSPVRTVVPADPQYGLWPALEHYAKLQAPPPQY